MAMTECVPPPADAYRAIIARIAEAFGTAGSILLCGHENPDGDAIGSILALARALRSLGKHVVTALPGVFPDKYRFLPGSAEIVAQAGEQVFDVAVALDCDGPQRLADLRPDFERARVRISIDHHGTREPFAELCYLNTQSAATGTQVYHLLREAGLPITPEIAVCIYTSVATDTGNFRFQNTNAEALRVAGEMAALGAIPYEIAQATGDEKPLRALKLLGCALASLRTYAEGRIALGVLTIADEANSGAEGGDSEGIIDAFKATRGAEVYVLLRETPNTEIRGSLRSKTLDVAAVAQEFGGGGHKAAAGFTAKGTLAEAEAAVVQAIEKALP
jgi:phosphoesterase RecJ-like protein